MAVRLGAPRLYARCLSSVTANPAAARRARRGRARAPRALAVLLAIGTMLGVSAGAGPASAYGPALQTSVTQNAPPIAGGPLTFDHIRAAGASFTELSIPWKDIAPGAPSRGFNASDPNSGAYDWRESDYQVKLAVASGVQPVIDIGSAPGWALLPGTSTPDPVALAQFTHAAAERYNGTRPGLPRVRYWAVWNEPNVSMFMAPQQAGGQPVAVYRYRDMVNDVAAQVHSVMPDNLVVAGQLFPNFVNRPDIQATAPLTFLRALFCLSADRVPRPTCHTQVNADIWSVHPYSSGQPSDMPPNQDAVWIANLASMRKLLDAAHQAGNLVSPGRPAFWVTEFGWNTSPPNPGGVPVQLDARWLAESLYRMWSAGVSVASYFNLRDDMSSGSIFHSGLYYACAGGLACDQPKPLFSAFRFPFVALPGGGRRVVVWGRTPFGTGGRVTIQVSSAHGWRGLAALRTDGNGIFTARLRVARTLMHSSLRALLPRGAGASIPFVLKRPSDMFVAPFS